MRRPGALARLVAAGLGPLAFATSGHAAGSSDLAVAPPGALSCSGCHATAPGLETSVPSIVGRPVDEIVAAMAAFRSGARPATVMNRIAPGFDAAETRAIAVWLGAQGR